MKYLQGGAVIALIVLGGLVWRAEIRAARARAAYDVIAEQSARDSARWQGEIDRLVADAARLDSARQAAVEQAAQDSAAHQADRARGQRERTRYRARIAALEAAGADSADIAGVREAVEAIEREAESCSLALTSCQRVTGLERQRRAIADSVRAATDSLLVGCRQKNAACEAALRARGTGFWTYVLAGSGWLAFVLALVL